MTILEQTKAAHHASLSLALLTANDKNKLLKNIQKELLASEKRILVANAKDVVAATQKKLGTVIDRITLFKDRIAAIAKSLDELIALPDPVGSIIDKRTRPTGLRIERVRVPIGVIGMIYEARPNVTVDAAALCLKSGNAVVLKGGSAARHSNVALVEAIHRALKKSGLSQDVVQFIDRDDHRTVAELLKCDEWVNCIIPRGSKALIDFVRDHSRIPVIETGASVVHLYVDSKADLKKAIELVINSKTRRVAICGALDVLLVHQKIAPAFLPRLAEALKKASRDARAPLSEIRADLGLKKYFKDYKFFKKISARDFDTEFLDYVLAIKVVKNTDEALDHIQKHSLKHTEAIVTEDAKTAERFLKAVDAACVYWNASTQFSDGGEFGLGAEIGISTQKLHVRGPFALEGLTSYKWVVRGKGQTRV